MPRKNQSLDVTVSIATYDRVELLRQTLQSCLDQKNDLGLTYEILVTDNHPTGSAETMVKALAASSPIPIRYQQDRTRNMSALRNVGIKRARGDYVAFIDDDEVADADWLDQLMGAIRKTGADIAVGPRLAIFAEGRPPPYDPQARMFERIFDLPDHAVIDLVRPDGKTNYGMGTGNSIFRVATCMTDPEPFDLAFGNAGGEDVEFFVRQFREGRRIVWAANARVTEVVPAHRTEIAYRLIRTRRESQIFRATYLAAAANPRRVQLELTLKGILQVAAGAAITLATWEFGSRRRLRGRALMEIGKGKISLRKPVGYIDEKTFKSAAAP